MQDKELPGWRWSGLLHSTSKAIEQFTDSALFLVLFWGTVHIPRSRSWSSSVFLRSCSHSESLKFLERGHEAGRVDSLGSVQVPHWPYMEHKQVYTLAVHKFPPNLLGFPKSCNSQSLQKIPLQILLFHQQQNLLSTLFYLPSSWEEFGLKHVSWKAPDENSKPEAHQQ